MKLPEMQEQPLCWDLRRWGFDIAIQTRNVAPPLVPWSSISFALVTFCSFLHSARSHLRTPWGYRSTWELQHPSFRILDQSVLTDHFDWDFRGLNKAFCIHWNHLCFQTSTSFFGDSSNLRGISSQMKMANPRRCSCDAWKMGVYMKTATGWVSPHEFTCWFEAVSAAEVVPVSNIVKAWIVQNASLSQQFFFK